MRFLFILKKREASWGVYSDDGYRLPSGLRNSVTYTCMMLRQLGFEAASVEVHDANDIDREVTLYGPDVAIIEAFWVPPGKFTELKALWRHRHVQWAVRNHSKMPFLSQETQAMTYIATYLREGVEVTCNSPQCQSDLQGLSLGGLPIGYTPNWYPIGSVQLPDCQPHPPRYDDVIRIGCFGALRPLKSPLLQLGAAIRFARLMDKRLEFYVNSTRVEMGASPILKNLRATAAAADNCQLIELPWMDTVEFLEMLQTIDVHLQLSLSETFNICSCDAVSQNVPVVVSAEVPWLGDYALADPTDGDSIVERLMNIHFQRNPERRIQQQRQDLLGYSRRSERVWLRRYG